MENRELYSACAHDVSVTFDDCGLGQPSGGLCIDHRIFLTVYPGFCGSCCGDIVVRYAEVGFRIARSLFFISEYWTGRARRHDDDSDAGKPRLSEQPVAGVVGADVDFEAKAYWKRALEDRIASCFPESVKMGGFLWPGNPWVGRGDGDRLAEIARAAQVRTIRWAAGLDPDSF